MLTINRSKETLRLCGPALHSKMIEMIPFLAPHRVACCRTGSVSAAGFVGSVIPQWFELNSVSLSCLSQPVALTLLYTVVFVPCLSQRHLVCKRSLVPVSRASPPAGLNHTRTAAVRTADGPQPEQAALCRFPFRMVVCYEFIPVKDVW